MSRSRVTYPRALSIFLFATVPVVPFLMAPIPARAADVFESSTTSDEANALMERVKPAIVQVHSGHKFILAGSGFFIDDRGTVITSSSILGENTSARVVINGVEMDAKVIGNDPRSGLAMLRADYDESPSLPLGHSNDLKTGNNIVMVGYPLSLPVACAQGPVNGFDISYLAKVDGETSQKESLSAVERFATTHIHANVPISPGQVGGPLLNMQGEVIGLVATSPDEGKTIYALPVEAMEKIIADFNQYGRARHGWVGVNVVEAPDTNHDGRTVRVVQAVPGTPASQSGIQPGDTVMRVDTREIYRPADVLDASFFSHVGGNMTVVVRRDQKLFNYTFAVIERPEPAAPNAAARRDASVPIMRPPNAMASLTEPISVNQLVSKSP